MVRAICLMVALSACSVDWNHPKFSGAFAEHLEYAGEPGDGGFEPNRELDGAINKFRYGGWQIVARVTWTFDWPLSHKLPGEK